MPTTFSTDSGHSASTSALALTAIAAGALFACAAARAQALPPAAYDFAPGRVLVAPKVGLPEAALQTLVKENGGKGARRIGGSELRIVDVPPGAERHLVERLSRHPHFKFAELDLRFPSALTPNDPYFGSQWHHNKIGSPAAWDYAAGSGVTVAVLDTGVDASHPELATHIVPGWNFFANNSDTTDTLGHGTAVAGTVAASTNNGTGVAAVAGSARIMPIRISDGNGNAYSSTIAQAITYAADHGARVANISFENLPTSTAVQSAAQYMKNKNGLVIVAAGNTGSNLNWAATSTMIPVAATTSSDALTSFSSWGPYVAMSAPGIDIWTTRAGGTYWYCWGTSFAAPVTAGVVALMMSVNPSLTSSQIESLLYSSAADLGPAGRDPQFGHGRVNAYAAVNAARSATTPADTQAPTATISAPTANATVSGLVPVNASASDNVGVAKVELRVNGALVATDSVSPFGFSWDSTRVSNGMSTLTVTAYDSAGNSTISSAVSVNVANNLVADTTAPTVTILTPTNGGRLKPKGSLTVSAAASDDRGSAGLRQSLYIDNTLVATASGGSLSYAWSLNKVTYGGHVLKVVAVDAAGNSSSTSVTVTK